VEAGKKRLAGDIVRQALPRVSSVEGTLMSSIVL
jgi:ribosomal protein S7